jgi:hypothetical protein
MYMDEQFLYHSNLCKGDSGFACEADELISCANRWNIYPSVSILLSFIENAQNCFNFHSMIDFNLIHHFVLSNSHLLITSLLSIPLQRSHKLYYSQLLLLQIEYFSVWLLSSVYYYYSHWYFNGAVSY